MRIVFFGTPQFAIPTLEHLLANPQFQVVGVVTQPDKVRGRGNQVIPSPIAKIAQAHQLPIFQPERIKKAPENDRGITSARRRCICSHCLRTDFIPRNPRFT